jgi:WD40-like Beta Propeller Repeat
VSAVDPIAAVLSRLDRPARPRTEFAESLRARLLTELAEGSEHATLPSRLSLRPGFLPSASPRLRLALMVIALLLLLAAIAAAAYLGIREWVSESPRGVQVTSDYQLTRVFRDAPARSRVWYGFVLGPGGEDLYALMQPPPHPQRRADLVRLPGVASAARPVEHERVLSLDSLSNRPGLWDPGTELTNTVVGPYVALHLEEGGQADPLAAAENGDLFLAVGVWRERDEFHWRIPPVAASVIVRHGDGSLEKVLTLQELVREALPGANPVNIEVEIAASQPGRLWLKARAGEPTSSTAGLGRYSVIEVVDPDGDGRWDDRTVRRLALPDSIPTADFDRRGFQRTAIPEIEAEPGSQAFVLTAVARAGSKGRFRIFAVEDRNGDGDANDGGEISVVLDRSGVSTGVDFGPVPSVSVRPDADGGLVATRLTRPTRITLVSPSGEQTDIGRSFEALGDVLAGTGGDIYVVRQVPGGLRTPPSWIGYRLTRAERERNGTTGTAPETAVSQTIRSPDVPRIAFLKSADFERGRIVTVRADGRGGVRPLVPGRFNHGFCQSANRKRVAYLSDAEAPHEPFIYLANADGSSGRRVSELDVGFWCGFSEHWLLLTRETGRAMTLIRLDLRTGAKTSLVRNVDRLALSPAGNTIVFVGRLDFGDSSRPTGKETLELLNMNTLERRRLAGPPTRGRYSGLTWSPDGRRIAYTIKAASRRRVLEVRDTRYGSLVLHVAVSGGPPSLSWSPDRTRLLVCVPTRGSRRGCSDGLPQARPSARLIIVDVPTGRRQLVVRGELLWADWSPTGGYGYATRRAVFAVTAAGRTRQLAAAPQRTRAGSWLGFSPDGRYIGLGDFSTRLAVVNVKTGKLRILIREHKGGGYIMNRTWWR